jgi:hypothetical protein
MRARGATAVIVSLLASSQLELDCAQPAAARSLVGRIMLSEIEGAEDVSRAAMWEAFGRCPGGPDREACVALEKRRFEAEWEATKAAIEARYRKILDEFSARCQGSLL